MTPDAINMAIATWRGWGPNDGGKPTMAWGLIFPPAAWLSPEGERAANIPDYYHSLDAVHEAELRLRTDGNTWQPGGIDHYISTLVEVCRKSPGMYHTRAGGATTATAPQRCEALLRTLGLWKGDK